MPWLLVTISSYLILAVVFLVDKYLLVGPIPNPKVYAFFVGSLGIFVLILVPFVGFQIPAVEQVVLSLSAGIVFIWALFWFYKGLQIFEASRVVPAIGGLVPIFTFLLVYILSFGKEILSLGQGTAFILLILGTILVTLEKEKLINLQSLKISFLAAFLFSLSFVMRKYVYLAQPFLSGYIWITIGGFLMALIFLFLPEVRRELLKIKMNFPKRTAVLFLCNQAGGISANILQNWAIALAPLVCVAIINALQGVQYVFLLMFAVLLSLTQPLWAKRAGLKEEISRKILVQKIIAITLIGMGLAFLVL